MSEDQRRGGVHFAETGRRDPGSESPVNDEYDDGGSAMDMSEEERAMFDELVMEEMAKLDLEVREQAMIGLAHHKTSKQSSSHHLIPELPDSSSQFIPRQSASASAAAAAAQERGRLAQYRPIQEPRLSSSEQKTLSAPVTVLMAKRQAPARPSNEGGYVPQTILSGIGATARKNERQKLAKREEFMRAVAEDEAKRRELRRNEEDDVRVLPMIMSKEERENFLERQQEQEGEASYSSRWDTLGHQPNFSSSLSSPNSKQALLLQRKREQQKGYAQLLKQQQDEQEQRKALEADWRGGGGGGGGVSLSLPGEDTLPYDTALLPDGKARHVSRFSSNSSNGGGVSEVEEKRIKQRLYHEQLAQQISGGPIAPSRPTNAPAPTAPVIPAERRSFLDAIGETDMQKKNTLIKRQQQMQYHHDLASSSRNIPTQQDRVSLLTTRRRPNAESSDAAAASGTSISIGADEPTNFLEAKAFALAVKRQQQLEYSQQLKESAARAPILSPRSSLKARRQLNRTNAASDVARGGGGGDAAEDDGGAYALLAKGLTTMGPSTTHALKRHQQEQYRRSLEDDRAEAEFVAAAAAPGAAGVGTARLRFDQQPEATGLVVGSSSVGTATRQSYLHARQQSYAQQLSDDKLVPAIPLSFVPKNKPPSACSPRPGEERDYNYFATGTSIQVGAPTADRLQEKQQKTAQYKRELERDLGRGETQHWTSSPRAAASSSSSDPSTAEAIIQRQRERQQLIEMLASADSAASAPRSWGGVMEDDEPLRGRIQRRANPDMYMQRAAEEGALAGATGRWLG